MRGGHRFLCSRRGEKSPASLLRLAGARAPTPPSAGWLPSQMEKSTTLSTSPRSVRAAKASATFSAKRWLAEFHAFQPNVGAARDSSATPGSSSAITARKRSPRRGQTSGIRSRRDSASSPVRASANLSPHRWPLRSSRTRAQRRAVNEPAPRRYVDQLRLYELARHSRPTSRPADVLDLGSGSGFHAALLASWGYRRRSESDIAGRRVPDVAYFDVAEYDGRRSSLTRCLNVILASARPRPSPRCARGARANCAGY